MRTATLALTLAVAACGADGSGETAEPVETTAVGFLEYVADAPAAWRAREPSSRMRLAEWVAGAGEPAPQVVVYYFGPGQGGSVEANIARWRGQFTDPQGGHPEPEVTELDDTPFPITVAELEGSYARGIGMGGDRPAEPGQRLVAAVVETPRGNLYIQLFGPDDDVVAARAAYLGFLRSIRPAPGQGAA